MQIIGSFTDEGSMIIEGSLATALEVFERFPARVPSAEEIAQMREVLQIATAKVNAWWPWDERETPDQSAEVWGPDTV